MNSFVKINFSLENIITIGFLENPIKFSIFPIGKLFLLWKLSFSYGILNCKGKYLTCPVRHTKTEVVIYNL